VFEQAFLHYFLGPQFVTPMDQRDLAGEIGQEQCFLDGGVAAADHEDFFLAVEESIARGASRHAKSLEFLFGFKPQPFRTRARRDDDAIRRVNGTAIALQPERAFG
jgi:hypothetical protein